MFGCNSTEVNQVGDTKFYRGAVEDDSNSSDNISIIENLRSSGFECSYPTPIPTPKPRTVGETISMTETDTEITEKLSIRCIGRVDRDIYPLDISIFIPYAFQVDTSLHLVLHMHGFLVKPIEEDVFNRFNFEQKLEEAHINAILVVPESEDKEKTYLDQWRNNSTKFDVFLNGLVNLFRQTKVISDSTLPDIDVIRQITITGHSGAFRPIAHLYDYQGIYSGKIKAIGLFDAMFSSSDLIVPLLTGWGQYLTQQSDSKGLFFHVSGPRTRYNSGLILRKINSNLSHKQLLPENVQYLSQYGCHFLEVANNNNPDQHWNIFNDYFVPFLQLSDRL